MSILLPALAAACAAFCLWLIVRIVNRRERWAKRMLTVVVGVPALYVLGFGPTCWLVDRGFLAARPAAVAYFPILKFIYFSDSSASKSIEWYARIGNICDHQWTTSRLFDAAGLTPWASTVWPQSMRHDEAHRSDDY
ncbi:MAG: hypothetical protein HY290_17800 [Planctomycetia bacterium]|nr:hypothetical protein [Planctomycetia bacterium]